MGLPRGYHHEVIEAKENSLEKQKLYNRLIEKVPTGPLKSGGANFKTNVLIKVSDSKLVYKPSFGMGVFAFIFFTLGFGILFFNIYPLLTSNSTSVNWFLLIFGTVFASAGGLMFYFFNMPRVFDERLGLYYKAYKPKVYSNYISESKNQVALNSIIAVQIIGEHIQSDKGSYKSFELNLVLEDATRKNVVDHGNLKSIIDDAHMISEFLDIPIWHAKSADS